MVPQLLVVDDEQAIRDLLQRHFRYLGYQVETAEDGVRALRVLESLRVDIVISDIKMPGMDGIQLLREIRAEYPMIHVIMITGYVTQDNILSCMRHGAETCVFKPLVDLSELESAVDQAWKGIQRWWQILAGLGMLAPNRAAGERG
jgi:CheY-like chemotaxis protein